ncbi:MAG: TrkH family potassium uptake protein [Clostridia bacterium]|nr:TrkH family potassium uptake protein [Clostridia bacterium]
MNYKMVFNTLGKALLIEAILLLFPMFVGVLYQENTFISYLLPILGLILVGAPLSFLRVKDKSIYAKEGFVIVAMAWIALSLVGALPFVISGQIPNYVDALFETVSGFTTTGASILSDVEALSKSILFWRSFTHWIGGMGVLVFVLAVLPADCSGAMHVFRAESPGPTVGKLVSKLSYTARILYTIYFVMTFLETVLLLFGGLSFYDALLHAFSTAGTGGFGLYNDSVAHYDSVYVEMVIATFMLLFGVNFNVYYLILIKQVGKAIKSEELFYYLSMVVVATLLIAFNILSQVASFGQALRYSFFQVTSISSTTGFYTADFDKWPTFSKAIILLLMVVGASAGSTGGGMKVTRIALLIKSSFKQLKRLVNPRSVVSISFEKEPVPTEVERNVRTYFVLWALVAVSCFLLLTLDPNVNDLMSNLSATLACIGNIGPGLNLLGPTCNFGIYTPFSKILLSFVMLVGRLEIFPMLILFVPRTWKRG